MRVKQFAARFVPCYVYMSTNYLTLSMNLGMDLLMNISKKR